MLVEIEHAEIVIGGCEVRRQLEHSAILFNRCGGIPSLLSGFGLRVERLNLRRDFVIGGGLRVDRNTGYGQAQQSSQTNLSARPTSLAQSRIHTRVIIV